MDSNEGIKLSYPGVDVETAPDYELIYNSSWPTLTIIANPQISQNYPGPGGGTEQIYHHGLGYVPLFIPYSQSLFTSGSVPSYAEMGARQNISADSQYIYFEAPTHTLDVTLNTAIMIFPIDIESSFTAPTINTGLPGNIKIDKNYGIKASKNGKNINSNDLRDFTVHSSTRGPLLHAVFSGQADGTGNFFYTHSLSYAPVFLAYVQILGSPHKYLAVNGYAGVSTSGQTISLKTGNNFNCSIVVLKDPLDPLDNIINVNV